MGLVHDEESHLPNHFALGGDTRHDFVPPNKGPGCAVITAQRTFFAPAFDRVPCEMYSRAELGSATRGRSRVTLGPHSRLSTNTYYGRFPASYWQRWTRVTEVHIDVTLTGAGQVRVFASDADGQPRVVSSQRVLDSTDRCLSLVAAIDTFIDGGALWLEFETTDGPLTVREVRWSVAAPQRLRPAAIVMCTFNRPDDCLFTLHTLSNDSEALPTVDAVYVIDQGSESVRSHPRFNSVRRVLGPKLHYVRQANLGGSGGFTRGLYEIAGGPNPHHANVLFLDDDILLDPESVTRLTAFANSTTEPAIVGAQMLHLLHPHRLHVSAETARFTPVEPGLASAGSLRHVDLTKRNQDLRVDADYNAWWCCMLPAEVVTDAGYPLPLFCQWDDVEYGYRCRQRGHATVTLPGAAVWHADFDWKDEDEWVRYFTLRNALIITVLRGEFRPSASARVFLNWALRCLVSLRYAETATLIKAVEDFLGGPGTLHDGGQAALAEVRAIRARYPETHRHAACEVPGITATARPLATAGPAPSRKNAVLAKRLIFQLLGKIDGTASVATRDAHWWHVSLFRTAVVTDASQECVRLRRFDRRLLIRLGRQAVRTAYRLARDGARVQHGWRTAESFLSSRNYWTRLLRESSTPDSQCEVTHEHQDSHPSRAGADQTQPARQTATGNGGSSHTGN